MSIMTAQESLPNASDQISESVQSAQTRTDKHLASLYHCIYPAICVYCLLFYMAQHTHPYIGRSRNRCHSRYGDSIISKIHAPSTNSSGPIISTFLPGLFCGSSMDIGLLMTPIGHFWPICRMEHKHCTPFMGSGMSSAWWFEPWRVHGLQGFARIVHDCTAPSSCGWRRNTGTYCTLDNAFISWRDMESFWAALPQMGPFRRHYSYISCSRLSLSCDLYRHSKYFCHPLCVYSSLGLLLSLFLSQSMVFVQRIELWSIFTFVEPLWSEDFCIGSLPKLSIQSASGSDKIALQMNAADIWNWWQHDLMSLFATPRLHPLWFHSTLLLSRFSSLLLEHHTLFLGLVAYSCSHFDGTQW